MQGRKSLLTFIILLLAAPEVFSQVYMKKQSRHRFAQLNLGVDLQAGFGGNTQYTDGQGNIQSLDLKGAASPRLMIGGTHFWGHADFYIAIPVSSPVFKEANQEIEASRGVETVMKYYPWKIENQKIRPYIGTSLTPFQFQQTNKNLIFPEGPELYKVGFPLQTGFTYNSKQHLIELGLTWNYDRKMDYYISRNQTARIAMAPLYASLSYRFMLETTLSAEKDWESGRTKAVTDKLARQGKLNGFYGGVGISSAFWLNRSPYNQNRRRFIGRYPASIMPDFSLGYYLHKQDLNIALGYRGYGAEVNTYGVRQELNRRSLVLEATKYLFDYNGFAAFAGPALSYENLSFRETFEGNEGETFRERKPVLGLTFGWDIRPNRIQSFLLRTNLRYFPKLSLDVASNEQVAFNNLEFNFIQLIIFPNRMF